MHLTYFSQIHRFIKSYIASRWAKVTLARLEALAEKRREASSANPVRVLVEENAFDEENAREWIIGALIDALAAIPSDLVKRAFVDNGILGGSLSKIPGQLFNYK